MIRMFLRSTHIIAGSSALVLAVAALCLAKGGRYHRSAGQAFVVAGRIVIGSALIASLWATTAPDSFVGRTLDAETRTGVRLLLGLLGVLGLLSATDLEMGLGGLGLSDQRLVRVLGAGSAIAGLVCTIGGLRTISGFSGLPFFAILIGIIGISDGLKIVRRQRELERTVNAHLTGMIASFGGFLAAFMLFGAGRLVNRDVEDGDLVILVPVVMAIVGSQLLSRWWVRRLASVPDRALLQGQRTEPL